MRAVDRHAALIFLTPALIGVLIADGVPMVYGLVLSLFDQSLSNPTTRFVGLRNYRIQLGSADTWHSIYLTVIYTVISVAASFALGMVSALLLNGKIWGRGIMRGILIIPWAVPIFVAAVTWQWMYNDQFGIIDATLKRIGVMNPPEWLSAQYALMSVIVVTVWKSFPFQMLLILAGLQSIPDEIYDAAKTDGASVLQRFYWITMPFLRPIVLIAVLVASINAFQSFTLPWIMTQGGPVGATKLIAINSYNISFGGGEISQGAAVATIMFIIILIGAVTYLWRYVKQMGSL